MSPCSPASPQLPATETPLGGLQLQPDPPDSHHSPNPQLGPASLLQTREPRELIHYGTQLLCELQRRPEGMEAKGGPVDPPAEDMDAPGTLSEPAEFQTTAVSPYVNPGTRPGSTGRQGDQCSSPAAHTEGPTLAPVHSPAEPSAQLSPSCSGALSDSTEDQLRVTTSPPSPVHCSPTLCSDGHSPPSPGAAGRQTPPADTRSQPSRLRSPTQGWRSGLPPHLSDGAGAPTDQDRSGSSREAPPAQRLHPACSLLEGRSTAAIKVDSSKPLSAPCSPSPSQHLTRSSVSQPTSPVHPHPPSASPQLAAQSGVVKCTSECSPVELHCVSIQPGSLSPISALSTDGPEDKPSMGCPAVQKSPVRSSPPHALAGPSPAGAASPADLPLFESDESVAAHPPHPSVEPGMSPLIFSPHALDHVSIVSEAARTGAVGEAVPDQEKMVGGSAEAQANGSPVSPALRSPGPGLRAALALGRSSPCSHTLVPAGPPGESPSQSSSQSSLAPTTTDSQSPAHSVAEPSPGGNTGTCPGPEAGPNEADPVMEVNPEPVLTAAPSQPGSGSSSPLRLRSTEAAPSPRRSSSSSPTQVHRPLLGCSSLPGASACALASSSHPWTSSPADTQVHPSPGCSPPEEPPSTVLAGPAQTGDAAECEYQELQV